MGILSTLEKASSNELLYFAFSQKQIRHQIFQYLKKRSLNALLRKNSYNLSLKTRLGRAKLVGGLINSLETALDKNLIAPSVQKRLTRNFIRALVEQERIATRQEFENVHGFEPPLFLLLSPTGKCNLHCKGCYANSSSLVKNQLSYDTMRRIMTEKQELWGSYFTVISGGEPFMWHSQGKNLIDLVEEFPEQVFLTYTNGTLITAEIAERLAEAGNISPALSVEGWELHTDARRGKGVFKKIVRAFENLRQAGVPFGISITATTQNASVILDDELLDFYLNEMGALYVWIFQYMPIGRSNSLDIMVTPEQRVQLYKDMERQVQKREVFIVEFWNSGPYTYGCLAAGRPGGYFAITWNGDAIPCVFFPYSGANVVEAFAKGQTLNDVLFNPLFTKLREWQETYSSRFGEKPQCNQLMPCPIRDHIDYALDAIKETNANPIDQTAAIALNDAEYQRGMREYDVEVEKIFQPIWDSEFVHSYSDKNSKEVF